MSYGRPLKSLVDTLCEVADLWCAAHEPDPAPHARLGKLAVGDGGFFTRLPTQKKGATTNTLERFARFLLNPENWPDNVVPQEARELGHRCGVCLSAADLSAGKAERVSTAARGEAA